MADALKDTGKRVVVIGEDDEPIAILLRDALNDEPGYQAVVVTDGRHVIDTVASVRADLLILDIMMPGLSGFEIFDRIRTAPNGAMPILFISAAAGHYRSEFAERGITDVIAKPFDLGYFLARVQAMCPAPTA